MSGEEFDLKLAIGDLGVGEGDFWSVEFDEGGVVRVRGIGEAGLLAGEIGDEGAPEMGGIGDTEFVEGGGDVEVAEAFLGAIEIDF